MAGWAGDGKKILTAKGVLRKQDVPTVAAVIGVKAPQAVRSAADLPELHVAWCVAIGMGPLSAESGDEPEPFDQAAVNTALAGILRS